MFTSYKFISTVDDKKCNKKGRPKCRNSNRTFIFPNKHSVFQVQSRKLPFRLDYGHADWPRQWPVEKVSKNHRFPVRCTSLLPWYISPLSYARIPLRLEMAASKINKALKLKEQHAYNPQRKGGIFKAISFIYANERVVIDKLCGYKNAKEPKLIYSTNFKCFYMFLTGPARIVTQRLPGSSLRRYYTCNFILRDCHPDVCNTLTRAPKINRSELRRLLLIVHNGMTTVTQKIARVTASLFCLQIARLLHEWHLWSGTTKIKIKKREFPVRYPNVINYWRHQWRTQLASREFNHTGYFATWLSRRSTNLENVDLKRITASWDTWRIFV